MKNMEPLDIMFPILVVALVFMGIFTLFLLSNNNLMASIAGLDTQIGMSISHSRFKLMDKLAPHLSSIYFWIPFYCTVLLVLAGLERVKFLRICSALTACLLALVLLISGFNGLAAYSPLAWCRVAEHDYVRAAATGKCFSISTSAAVAFGLAVFSILYLGKRYNLLKVALMVWALLVIYGQVYQGLYYPGTLLLSMVAGTFIAVGCNAIFKRLFIKLYE
ncbi:hypothetical protein [Mucilaginibacter sp.]|jgi:undecaprenyl-diphosphatase|uniref:hypothetical protein n=1 Tax=Mucilaginibacter sp. TaxID=1882438 RepID=UPI003568FE76